MQFRQTGHLFQAVRIVEDLEKEIEAIVSIPFQNLVQKINF